MERPADVRLSFDRAADVYDEVRPSEASLVLCRLLAKEDGFAPEKFDSEIKARASRMVRDHLPTYGSVTKAADAVGSQLGIGGSTLRRWVVQADVDDGQQPAARTVSDALVVDALLATRGTPEGLYGRRKMTAHLRRLGRQHSRKALEQVSHHTVARLMRDLGLCGVRRGKKLRTTIADPAAPARSPDLLERDFTALSRTSVGRGLHL